MNEYYTPQQVAFFLYEEEYGYKEIKNTVNILFKKEYSFIEKSLKTNKDKFFKDTIMYYDFLTFKEEYENQINGENKFNHQLLKFEKFMNNFSPNFFLITRLMLLFGHNYRLLKLRTLLKKYGYKSRVSQIMQKFRDCIIFYHLKTYNKGEEMDINNFKLDDMITFKLY